ncbi:MAG: hypothetical protein ACR2MM_11750 [Flavobacteriaceae bacterium]
MTSKPIVSLALILIFISCTEKTSDKDYVLADDSSDDMPSVSSEEPEVEFSDADLVYAWVSNMQHDSGLMESAEGTDFVSLYDNALASLIFIANGDLEKAEKIFDYFNTRIDSELLFGTGGFYQFRNTTGANGSRTWLGDNAWLLIALNNYKELTNSNKYNRLSEELQNWIRSLQGEDGSLKGGYNEDGTEIGKITEGIITAYNAVRGYDDFHKNILNYLNNERWNASEFVLMTQNEYPQYQYALDLHSLGYLVLDKYPNAVLEQAVRYQNIQLSTSTSKQLVGYCFDEDLDVIWLEGTAQIALAYKNAHQYSRSANIIEEIEKTFINSEISPHVKGLPYTANQGTCFGAEYLWDHADTKPALSSSIWYLFNKFDFNPLVLEQDKSVPQTDRFWIPVM